MMHAYQRHKKKKKQQNSAQGSLEIELSSQRL
jgi:hypothetical protein